MMMRGVGMGVGKNPEQTSDVENSIGTRGQNHSASLSRLRGSDKIAIKYEFSNIPAC